MVRTGSGVEQVGLQQSPLGDQWDSLHSLKTTLRSVLDVNVPYSLGCLNTWFNAQLMALFWKVAEPLGHRA